VGQERRGEERVACLRPRLAQVFFRAVQTRPSFATWRRETLVVVDAEKLRTSVRMGLLY
jgi:hypothetical protein